MSTLELSLHIKWEADFVDLEDAKSKIVAAIKEQQVSHVDVRLKDEESEEVVVRQLVCYGAGVSEALTLETPTDTKPWHKSQPVLEV